MKTLSGAALALLCALSAGLTVAAEPPRNYAITHVTAIPQPGTQIEDATIVLRDGLIVSLESGGAVPPDTIEIDGTDRFVYAGLIDAHSDLVRPGGSAGSAGPRESGGDRAEAPAGATHPLALIHPEKRVADRLRPFADDRKRPMEKLRELGFTVVLATPASGILGGTSAALLLEEERPVAEILLAADVAQHASFQRAGFGQGYPRSLMGSIAAFRQALLDAQRYAVWSRRYQTDPSGMQRPQLHSAYEALLPLLNGEIGLIFSTTSPHDTLMADRLGREFGLDITIATSSYEAEYVSALASAGRTLIVSTGFPDKPDVEDDDRLLSVDRRTMRRYLDAASGPARLHEAGIRIALSSGGLDSKSTFYKQLRKIIAAGLPADTALAALTTVPAEILGIDRIVGTLSPGKIANLVVSDGPLFDEGTKIRELFVDGRRHELKVKEKLKGDPDAVVDPRGIWEVSLRIGTRTMERIWTIDGSEEDYRGSSESDERTTEIELIELAGNVMTIVFPGRGGRPSMEATVIITGDTFTGTAEMGPRTIKLEGTRTSGPDGGAR